MNKAWTFVGIGSMASAVVTAKVTGINPLAMKPADSANLAMAIAALGILGAGATMIGLASDPSPSKAGDVPIS